MRVATLLLVIGVSMVAQSCKIEMPSLVELITRYRGSSGRTFLYDFQKSRAVIAQGGLKGTFILGDAYQPEVDDIQHVDIMYGVIGSMGILKDNIALFDQFTTGGAVHGSRALMRGNIGLEVLTSGEHESLRKATRVVCLPLNFPLGYPPDIPRLQANNILFVVAAGNNVPMYHGDRDAYNSGHFRWSRSDSLRNAQAQKRYEYVLKAYETGKVIAATSARVTDMGTIEPNTSVVMCGDIKESCYVILPRQYASPASARLASISFYLSQFWDTAEEVVDVLNQCAVDIGEPGIDREYGRGLANLLCPPVLKKELEVVSSYMEESVSGEVLTGGSPLGTWEAENVSLVAHVPPVLRETVDLSYTGTVNGAVEFTDTEVLADFRAGADITAFFLLPLEVKAEEVVQTHETYTRTDEVIRFSGKDFTYTATDDSLHLVTSYSLNEALALLPSPLGDMVDMASEDFFTDDPIQIRMSFAKKLVLVGDFNEDGLVDFADFLLFTAVFGSDSVSPHFNASMDLVPDGVINFADFLVFIEHFDMTG